MQLVAVYKCNSDLVIGVEQNLLRNGRPLLTNDGRCLCMIDTLFLIFETSLDRLKEFIDA